MKNKEIILQIITTSTIFVLGLVFAFLIIWFIPSLKKDINPVVYKDKTMIYEKTSLSKAVSKIYDAVVVVQEYSGGEVSSTGTGFVYKVDDKYGYLLTNEHVLSSSNSVMVVTTSDEVIEAEILGKDEYLDLAVLRIDKKYVSLVANIGNSEKMKLGDSVFTVGSPLGYDYRGSVTSGILSGKDRMVSTSVSNSTNADWVMRVLQIDASINPGNSGGPLLDVNGEVIGICSLKLVDDDIEGMGFAIPIEYAMSHVKTLENGQKIKWPVLGIGMANVNDSSTLATYGLSLPENIHEGVVVVSVKNNTSAHDAGLKKGDIITKIDNTKVKNTAYLRYELYQHQSGDKIKIHYIRDNKEKIVKVVLKG